MGVAGIAAVALAAVAGCSSGQRGTSTTPPIKVASAYVIASQGPGAADCYLIIQNAGPTDQLLAVTSSTGGSVTIVSAVTTGAGGAASGVTDGVLIPGHSVVRFNPDGDHLVINHPVRIKGGTDITLTLRFAHAGDIKVMAQVADPQSGIYSYFGP